MTTVALAEIQPTHSLMGAAIHITVIHGLATDPVTVEIGP